MKLKCNIPLYRLGGQPFMVDQKQEIKDGQVVLTGGHVLTVGEVLTTILTNKRVPQFGALKAFALAKRIYEKESVELDEADIQGLKAMMEEQDAYVPLVAALVLQALENAKGK